MLNLVAKAWSRRPLHQANLDGVDLGKNERWECWVIVAGNLEVSSISSGIDVIDSAYVRCAQVGSH